MQNGKLEMTFVALSDHDKNSHVSYIRKIKPDYMLEIRGTGLCIEESTSSEILFEHSVDCHFFLNYGDLFLSALNAMESPQTIEESITWLSAKVANAKNKLNNTLVGLPRSSNGRQIDSQLFQKLNSEYSQYDRALSFALMIYHVVFEDQKRDGLFSAALTWLLTLPDNSFNYGELSAKELQENLKKNNLFSEITVQICYRNDNEEYHFSDLYNLVGFEVRQLIGKNSEIKICKNCGRFFIPANRRDEKYCDNAFRLKDLRTCKQVAFSMREDKDEVLKAYRKIYKTQNARKQRNGHKPNIATNFEAWAAFAKNRFTQCQNGEITLETMIQDISGDEWMSGNIPRK